MGTKVYFVKAKDETGSDVILKIYATDSKVSMTQISEEEMRREQRLNR